MPHSKTPSIVLTWEVQIGEFHSGGVYHTFKEKSLHRGIFETIILLSYSLQLVYAQGTNL